MMQEIIFHFHLFTNVNHGLYGIYATAIYMVYATAIALKMI